MPIMAYSPIERGARDQHALLGHPLLEAIAARHSATPAQVAIAWVIRADGIVTIPKAGTPEHMRENRAAADLVLDAEDLAELDRAFPPPRGKVPLEVR